MHYLNPLDAAFLRMESRRTPMHVSCLMIFKLPADAQPDYLKNLFAYMRSESVETPPYSYQLANRLWSGVAPAWEESDEVDLDYHLRHSALPHPGGERELGVLVSRLHSIPMDMEKPVWEVHLIEGLENRRFAIYFKAHHAAVDGMSALKMLKRWLVDSPEERAAPGPWAMDEIERPPVIPGADVRARDVSLLAKWGRLGKSQLDGMMELGDALQELSRSEENPHGGMVNPSDVPKTIFNTPITPHRRFATQLLDLDRLMDMSERSGCTINDLCLALCGTALRRYLESRDELPDKPLVASVPVGLPRPDGKPGNRVAGFTCPIGTDLEDPVARLRDIHETTKFTKERMKKMPDAALNQFSALGIMPLMIGQATNTMTLMPPLFNLTVSNVPGPREPKYYFGAEMEAMYPISVLFDNHTLNVTIVGYADKLTVGVTGCRDTIPNLQKIAVYIGEALEELDAALKAEPNKPKRKSASVRKKNQ